MSIFFINLIYLIPDLGVINVDKWVHILFKNHISHLENNFFHRLRFKHFFNAFVGLDEHIYVEIKLNIIRFLFEVYVVVRMNVEQKT
jgi:hypothetical protein